ncbi:MAG TPA: sugar phosphate isomerase/epimerase [Gemmatimonadaceae bacterium]|nr:sugar phosphate isomerase/epimerase [Gemmatimonadaceae bacterium]
MHRRDIVRMLVASAGGALLPWMRAPRRGPMAPGIQLYTVRSLMRDDPVGTLSALAQIGYREVEFAGLHGVSAGAMREALDRFDLTAPAAHEGLAELRSNAAAVFARARALGNRYVVVPWLDVAERRTLADYRAVAAELNALGRAADDIGIRLGYHNHDFELRPIAGTIPYEVLLEETDPSLVVMELDLFWLAKGGGDPATYFARHPGRFTMVHVKDMSADGAMVDVGQGTLDFRRIFAEAERAGIRHAFVEHDDPGDPLASARVSHAALARLLS